MNDCSTNSININIIIITVVVNSYDDNYDTGVQKYEFLLLPVMNDW